MCILFSCVRRAYAIWSFEGTLPLSVCCTCCQTDGDCSEGSLLYFNNMADLAAFFHPFYQRSLLFLLVFNHVVSLLSSLFCCIWCLQVGSLIIMTWLPRNAQTYWEALIGLHCAVTLLLQTVTRNVTSDTLGWLKIIIIRMRERVWRCPLPAFPPDYSVLAYGIWGSGVCVLGRWGTRLTAGRGLSARVQGGRHRPEVESERKRTFLWS